MTDRDVMERVAALLDRAVVTLRARREHHKTPFSATISGAPAVELMEAVYPFMGLARQREIQRAVLSWHRHRSRRRWPTRPCSVDDCRTKAAKRGLCNRHYNSWWKAHRVGRSSTIAPIDTSATILGAHKCDERCDFPWLVGLLEGEVTVTSSRSRGHSYPVLKLEMCDEDVVFKAARLLNSSAINRVEPERDVWSVTYTTSLSGADAADWMRKLRGLLGNRRSEAIDAALANYHPMRLVNPPESCVVPECSEPPRGRGLCHKHYMKWSRDRAKGRDARIVPLR